MLSRLKIRTRLLLVLAVPLVAVFGIASYGLSTVDAVKVDGEAYNEIVEAKDLVEDVVPPSEYLVESYLVVRQLSTETDEAQQDVLIDRLADLEQEYRDSHEYWSTRLDDQRSLKFALLQDAYAPAEEFWRWVDIRLIPALELGDQENVVRMVDGPINDAYERHRNAIDRVVRLAVDRQEEVAAETSVLVDTRTRWLLVVAVIATGIAILLGYLVVRSIRRPLRKLEQQLPHVAEELRELDLSEERPDLHLAAGGRDELGHATEAFNSVVQTAVDMAVEQARIQREVSETYLHLGRRNQNLLRRMLSFVTDLEQNERDEETLDHLFRLDHLATRMRRNAESLLVLAGAEPSRTWSQPIPVIDVVRSAVAEIEDFARVDLAVVEPAAVQGNAASDITHLLAELIENAAVFSPPTTRVTVHGRRREDGYLLSVVDHGLGMPPEKLVEANDRVAETSAADVAASKMLGLHVVGRLAQRHGLRVKLTDNPSGGVVAMAWLPFGLVGPMPAPSTNGSQVTAEPEAPPAPAAPEPVVVPEPVVAAEPVAAPEPVIVVEPEPVTVVEPEPVTVAAPAVPAPAEPPVTPVPTAEAPPVLSAEVSVAAPPAPGSNGLTPRRRGAQSPAEPLAPTTARSEAAPRSPDEVRSRLSRLQSGIAQGRRDRPTHGGPPDERGVPT